MLVDNVEAVHTLLWEKVINAEEIFENIQNPYVISIVQPTVEKMILLLDYETILLELTPEQSEQEKEKTKNLSFDGRGLKILIADDSPSIRDFLEQELLDNNFTVISAKDGKDALEKFNKEKIDLIISDVEMPRMDGLALTKMVRDDPEKSDLPIIVYSSIGDIGMKQRASYLKADHITKLNMDELLEKVGFLLKLQTNNKPTV